jgi:cytochrome bd ubiquinol oxidase subunit II
MMLAMYAILDGLDLGAGVIHLCLTRSESERRSVLSACGPFWDSNEVWLLLAGGALYCVFPAVYSSRGFSFAAIALVWLLILCGAGMEFRRRVQDQVEDARWRRFMDLTFGLGSILIALCLARSRGGVGDPQRSLGFRIGRAL